MIMLLGSLVSITLGLFLSVTSVFLILLVLVQRGRGGGLSGALGGMGGQSAFGAKAGDVFTRVTVVAAAVWILLCLATVKMLGSSGDRLNLGGADRADRTTAPASGALDTSEPTPSATGSPVPLPPASGATPGATTDADAANTPPAEAPELPPVTPEAPAATTEPAGGN